jgi:hypothetical protein
MSDKPILLRQSQERHFSAHNTFIHIAHKELELAKPGMVGEFNHTLVAITLSALAVESLANAIGDRVIPEWHDFESAAPYAKLRLLADHLGLLLSGFAGSETGWRMRSRSMSSIKRRLLSKSTRLVTLPLHNRN